MPIKPEIFIAKRLYFSQLGEKRSSRPAIKVALAGIIIGMIVMVITICVVVGFKKTVTDKIVGFGAHIQVTNFENNSTYELKPIQISDSICDVLKNINHVDKVEPFTTKPGIIKTDDAFQGIVFKGTDYWDYFEASLISGKLPEQLNEVLLSADLCNLLELNEGDDIYCYFVGENVKARKFIVSGIYQTGFGDFDQTFIIGDLSVVRKLNGWNENQVSGIEILVDNLDYLDETADNVYFATTNHLQDSGEILNTLTMKELNPQIFSWLDLLDINVVVIIILMLCVSGFNIISGLIILILDNIQIIGVLKALGASNLFVRRIFVTEAAMLIGKGLLHGNIIGLALCAIQYWTHVIPLETSVYYVSYVPIAFPVGWWIVLNIGTIFVSLAILLGPSSIVSKISPSKVMHFE